MGMQRGGALSFICTCGTCGTCGNNCAATQPGWQGLHCQPHRRIKPRHLHPYAHLRRFAFAPAKEEQTAYDSICSRKAEAAFGVFLSTAIFGLSAWSCTSPHSLGEPCIHLPLSRPERKKSERLLHKPPNLNPTHPTLAPSHAVHRTIAERTHD